MKRQARKQCKEAITRIAEILRDHANASHEVAEFAKINHPDKRYQRKQIIQWFPYFKKYYEGTYNTHEDGEVPMTKEARKKHCEKVFGFTTTEADQWRKELYDNPKLDCDNKGFQGRLQLWVPIGARRAQWQGARR